MPSRESSTSFCIFPLADLENLMKQILFGWNNLHCSRQRYSSAKWIRWLISITCNWIQSPCLPSSKQRRLHCILLLMERKWGTLAKQKRVQMALCFHYAKEPAYIHACCMPIAAVWYFSGERRLFLKDTKVSINKEVIYLHIRILAWSTIRILGLFGAKQKYMWDQNMFFLNLQNCTQWKKY